jgi:hypothetical protein
MGKLASCWTEARLFSLRRHTSSEVPLHKVVVCLPRERVVCSFNSFFRDMAAGIRRSRRYEGSVVSALVIMFFTESLFSDKLQVGSATPSEQRTPHLMVYFSKFWM